MLAEILTRQFLELRKSPHMMLAGGLVHRFERPRHPAYSALDTGEAQLGKTLEHARGAQARDRLDRRRKRVRRIVDNRAAIFARRARITPGRDMESDRDIAILNHRPQR